MAEINDVTGNRNYKDSLFRFIFKGNNERSRKWLLSLYNALRGSNYEDTSQLEITTLEDVIYISIKNDLSFLINDEMYLFEHQSTVNPNMPVRGLLYFSKLYENFISKQKLNIYGGKLIKLPTPKYIVFYNGQNKLPDLFQYHLSDAFLTPDDSNNFEWTATVININKNHSQELQKTCKALYDYSEFIARIRQNMEGENPLSFRDAVNEAMDYAIEHNFLEGYFREEKAKIMNSILTQFDKETYEKAIRNEGFDEGKQEKAIEAVIGLHENNVSVDIIAKSLKMTEEQVQKIISEKAQDKS